MRAAKSNATQYLKGGLIAAILVSLTSVNAVQAEDAIPIAEIQHVHIGTQQVVA